MAATNTSNLFAFIANISQLPTERDLNPDKNIDLPAPPPSTNDDDIDRSAILSDLSQIAMFSDPLLQLQPSSSSMMVPPQVPNVPTVPNNVPQVVMSQQTQLITNNDDTTTSTTSTEDGMSVQQHVQQLLTLQSSMEPGNQPSQSSQSGNDDEVMYTSVEQVLEVVEGQIAEKNGIVIKKKQTISTSKIKIRIRPIPDQGWKLIDIVYQCYPGGWYNTFNSAIHSLAEISEALEHEERVIGPYYPLKKDIFNAFHLCPLNNVKVVILGQDPYANTGPNGKPQAMGLSFSVTRDTPIPKTLRNIYAALKNSYPDFHIPYHGDLTSWARQGVLMLNCALTVKARVSRSHLGMWSTFLNAVLTDIGYVNKNCIYLLWGRPAQKMKKQLKGAPVVLEWCHPSPNNQNKFHSCDHFLKVNQILAEQGKEPIDWTIN